jgi:hypothetical protein
MAYPTIFISNYFLFLTEKNEDIIVILVLFTKFPKSTAQVGSVTCKTYNLSVLFFFFFFLPFSFQFSKLSQLLNLL